MHRLQSIALLASIALLCVVAGEDEFVQLVEYTEAVINQETPIPVRTGIVEWPSPLTYEGGYGHNELVWWYIPVPANWTLTLYASYHFVEEEYDRLTVWKVLEEGCTSSACSVRTQAFTGEGGNYHHNIIRYPSEYIYTVNASVIIEFRSDISVAYRGFKLDWIAHPSNQTLLARRSKRLCCTSVAPVSMWVWRCLRQPAIAEQVCECNTWSQPIVKSASNGSELVVRLTEYGFSSETTDRLSVNAVISPEGAEDLPVDVDGLNLPAMRYSHSVVVSATCPWTYLLGVEWYEVRRGAAIFSNEVRVSKQLNLTHGREGGGGEETTHSGWLTPSTHATWPTTSPWGTTELQPVQETVLTSPTGIITSPNFPRTYDDHSRVSWTIEAPAGTHRINLNFTDFNLEGGFDFLRIIDAVRGNETRSEHKRDIRPYTTEEPRTGGDGQADPLPIRLTGYIRRPFSRSVESRRINLLFTSDYSEVRSGFRLEYSIYPMPTSTPPTTTLPTTQTTTRPTTTRPTTTTTTTTTKPTTTTLTTTPPTTKPITTPTRATTPTTTTTTTSKTTSTTATTTTSKAATTLNAVAGQAKQDKPGSKRSATTVKWLVPVLLLLVLGVVGTLLFLWNRKRKANLGESYATFANTPSTSTVDLHNESGGSGLPVGRVPYPSSMQPDGGIVNHMYGVQPTVDPHSAEKGIYQDPGAVESMKAPIMAHEQPTGVSVVAGPLDADEKELAEAQYMDTEPRYAVPRRVNGNITMSRPDAPSSPTNVEVPEPDYETLQHNHGPQPPSYSSLDLHTDVHNEEPAATEEAGSTSSYDRDFYE